MAIVYDESSEKGITICFDEDEIQLSSVDGVPVFAVFMEDAAAEEMIAIIQIN